jgi:hypothetical protein
VEKATSNRQVQAAGPFGGHAVHIAARMNKFNATVIRRCADQDKLWTGCEEAGVTGRKSLIPRAFLAMLQRLVQSGDMWEKHKASVDAKA